MAAVTLDTGVFIALERRQRRALVMHVITDENASKKLPLDTHHHRRL